MNRRTFSAALTGLAAAASSKISFAQDALESKPSRFEANWASLVGHSAPQWFRDAKFGIFIHWGLYSVPAWAPPTGELGKVDWSTWFRSNPYAEWYLNTLRISGSPTYEHHVAAYGKDFDYYQFAKPFNAGIKDWHPDQWAALFKKSGARYAVLTSKHHDGFTLWPSAVPNPHASGRKLSADRDLVGDLSKAVRDAGLKMGLYYSGGLDWTFTSQPIQSRADLYARVPQSEEYARYADAHWRELMQRYQPEILWNDISYPRVGQAVQIFSEFYNARPEGLVNDRFGVPYSDFTTPEYAKYDRITEKKWESCRGLGFSFGYNQVEGPEQVIAPGNLVALLVDIVSKNGNLLLNIGPKPNGSISDIQLDRLHKLGDWLSVNGEGIFGSRPWIRPSATAADGTDVRFTRKSDSVYAFFLKKPAGNSLTVPNVQAVEGTKVQILGSAEESTYSQQGSNLVVEAKNALPESLALTVKITPNPYQLARD